MDWRKLTKAVVLAAVALISAYDVVAYFRGTVDATISRVVLGWAAANPVIPLAVGVLAGHLFWPQPKPPASK